MMAETNKMETKLLYHIVGDKAEDTERIETDLQDEFTVDDFTVTITGDTLTAITSKYLDSGSARNAIEPELDMWKKWLVTKSIWVTFGLESFELFEIMLMGKRM